MIVVYHPRYNFELGLLSHLHRFDGGKFSKIHSLLRSLDGVTTESPAEPTRPELIAEFATPLLLRLLSSKRYVLRALEVPYLLLVPFSFIENHVLMPMRWATAGTMHATQLALSGRDAWNLSGGYHHASRSSAEGFCVYNDIGLAWDHLLGKAASPGRDRVLIIDVDAHHGNGNARVFMDVPTVEILDIYNRDIYPAGDFTKERVNINVPIATGTTGDEYLSRLRTGLQRLHGEYRLAFVVAGTDVLHSDPLGGLGLRLDDCVQRDLMIRERLRELSTPAVWLGGGGYGRESAQAVVASIAALTHAESVAL